MPGAFHDIQPTFAGGELTPAMYSRVDMAKYKTALKTARNGIVHPQGGFSARPGFKYVAAAKYSNKKCRLIAFQYSSAQAYMIEVGDAYIRFYKNGAQIQMVSAPAWLTGTSYVVGNFVTQSGTQYYCLIAHTAGTFATDLAAGKWVAQDIYEIPSPYLEADLPLLKWTQSANTIYFAHPSYPPQTLVRNSDTNWVMSAFPFINGPYMLANADPTKSIEFDSQLGKLTSIGFTFDADQVGAWFQLTATVSPTVGVGAITGAGGPSSLVDIPAYKQWKVTTTGTWTGNLLVQYTIDAASPTWITISTLSANSDANYNTFGDIPVDFPVYLRVIGASWSSGTANVTLSADQYTYSYNIKTSSMLDANDMAATISPVLGVTPFVSLLSSNVWAEGSWSILRGWPSVVAFYQDRLGWGSTPAEPIALWMSQTGDYVNYGVSDPLVDSDAISVNLPSRKFNGINNLIQLRKFVALTASGEFSIGPGSSGVLSPSSIDQRQEGFRGCSNVNPIVIGYQGIYIQPLGTVVRNISYQFYTDTFAGENISLMANHLFENFTIVDMTYCQEPDSIAYFVRSDGQLLALTYLIEQQVVGWTHFDTQGSFESCASIPSSNYDELWVVVNRSFGRFIERLAQPLPTTDTKDQFHVDCGIDYSSAPATSISGLNYLEGQSVMVLADGNVQGPFTVVGGTITLPVAASLAHIGLSYTVDMETLNVELSGQDGTSQGRRQRIAQVTMRFINSLGGYVGPDANHLHPIVPSPPPSLGTERPLFSGDIRLPVVPSWNTNGRVFLRQTDPLPFNVTGLFPVVEVGNL